MHDAPGQIVGTAEVDPASVLNVVRVVRVVYVDPLESVVVTRPVVVTAVTLGLEIGKVEVADVTYAEP